AKSGNTGTPSTGTGTAPASPSPPRPSRTRDPRAPSPASPPPSSPWPTPRPEQHKHRAPARTRTPPGCGPGRSRRDTPASGMPAGRKLPTVTKNRNYPQPVKYLKPMALSDPPPCLVRFLERPQPFVFLPHPAHQVAVDALEQRIQRGAVKRPVILHPSPHNGINPPCELPEGPVR